MDGLNGLNGLINMYDRLFCAKETPGYVEGFSTKQHLCSIFTNDQSLKDIFDDVLHEEPLTDVRLIADETMKLGHFSFDLTFK